MITKKALCEYCHTEVLRIGQDNILFGTNSKGVMNVAVGFCCDKCN